MAAPLSPLKPIKTPRVSMISYHGLCYTVETNERCCSHDYKQVLNEISGFFLPGMNAIMGTTGCGKTTLLDVLSGRSARHGMAGHILVDGRPSPANLRNITGYVAQDDLVMETLTVRENLMFSANLRLPSNTSSSQKCLLVDNAISELGLGACANQTIGSYFSRGVSGGERKRTAIGMELIISPTVLFLDEPTTGLDASTAHAVLGLLHGLSRKGQMIVFSIHQPRYAIFKMFDRLTLLANGRTIYHGQAPSAVEYFDSIGYKCETSNNPSDFFIDVINGDYSGERRRSGGDVVDEGVFAGKRNYDNSGDGTTSPDKTAALREFHTAQLPLVERLAIYFEKSACFTRINEILLPIMSDSKCRPVDESERKSSAATLHAVSFITQVKYLSQRTVINIFRNPYVLLSKFLISITFATLLGVIFFQLDFTYPAGLQNRMGALFFVILIEVISNESTGSSLLVERTFFIHETVNGYYSVSAYYIAKVLCEFIAKRTVPLLIYSTIFYFMAGLRNTAVNYAIYVLVLYLVTLSSAAIITTFGAAFSSASSIATIQSVFYFLTLQYGGLFLNIQSIPWPVQWIKWLSIARYGNNVIFFRMVPDVSRKNKALLINELRDESFYFYVEGINGTFMPAVTGSMYLEWQGIKSNDAWDLWQNVVALASFTVGFFLIGYVLLRRQTKSK